jgi:DNA-binding FrmR family transcriptional regulator
VALKSILEERNLNPPDHAAAKRRINRARGQLDAVARMIDEKRYCPDIINQIRAATNAMRALEQEILRSHLEGCVKGAFESKDPDKIKEKIEEILKLTTF